MVFDDTKADLRHTEEYELVTVASLIEKEASNPEERPLVG